MSVQPNLPSSLQIIEVQSKSDLDTFIAVPNLVFQNDPAWVQPLKIERMMHLSAKHNPYFKHAEWQAWIAIRNGVAVGRISAQIDELHIERYQDATGFFGMLDAEDNPETFDLLLKTAEKWLIEKGMRRIRGPFNLSINEEMGVLIKGFDTSPVFMMSHALPYFSKHIELSGYEKVKDTIAYMIAPNFKAPAVMKKIVEKAAKTVNIRAIDNKKFSEEIMLLRDIFNDSWAENWSFVPFTVQEFEELGKNLRFLVDAELIQIAEIEGKAVAFIVALPNINEAIKGLNGGLLPFRWLKLLWRLKVSKLDSARVPLMGVRSEFQNTRLGAGLAFLVIDAVRAQLHKRGATKIELSWILEDNKGMRNIIESIGGEDYKHYRIYERLLN